MMLRLPIALLLTVAALGCNMPKYVADQSAKFNEQTEHVVEAFWDLEVAIEAMPAVIVQYEAMLALSPDNEQLLLGLARAYMAYASAHLEEQMAQALLAGDPGEADFFRHRTAGMYLRAKELGMKAMTLRNGNLRGAVKGGPQALRTHLRAAYDSRRAKDVRPLSVTGLAWGAAIALEGDKSENLPLAQVLVEHAVQLDPRHDQCAGLAYLGEATAQQQPARAKDYFERALTLCERKNHNLQVAYARSYAVATRDRALYRQLLEEVVNAKDLGNEVRLRNKLARRKAERYLASGDAVFARGVQREAAQ